jgi:hypothetical protein
MLLSTRTQVLPPFVKGGQRGDFTKGENEQAKIAIQVLNRRGDRCHPLRPLPASVRRASARLQSCHHRPRAPGSHGRTAPRSRIHSRGNHLSGGDTVAGKETPCLADCGKAPLAKNTSMSTSGIGGAHQPQRGRGEFAPAPRDTKSPLAPLLQRGEGLARCSVPALTKKRRSRDGGRPG